ncbi:MAG: hypothetical protein WAM18_08495, partial [Halobacillus sp.]|uniref:hypothetical protein n=1 Tax=Halobacillus sp. TaxID=56800 RepID=UPI003BB1BD92
VLSPTMKGRRALPFMVVLKLVEAGQGTSTFVRPVHTPLTKVLPLLNWDSRRFLRHLASSG